MMKLAELSLSLLLSALSFQSQNVCVFIYILLSYYYLYSPPLFNSPHRKMCHDGCIWTWRCGPKEFLWNLFFIFSLPILSLNMYIIEVYKNAGVGNVWLSKKSISDLEVIVSSSLKNILYADVRYQESSSPRTFTIRSSLVTPRLGFQ